MASQARRKSSLKATSVSNAPEKTEALGKPGLRHELSNHGSLKATSVSNAPEKTEALGKPGLRHELSNHDSAAKAGGVRFSEDVAATPSHVHFDEKLHDSVVMVIPEPDGNFTVKVGFLKTQHKYEIVFTLPEVPSLGKDVCPAPIPNPHLRITDIQPGPEGGLQVTCEYTAHQEGVLWEEVLLVSETNEDMSVRVKVHARVMDRHHGTPMLLDGVRCLGAELEYDSEQSDWQGFD